jgi:hypothetical protein
MRLNTAQKAIGLISVSVLLCLALFPPWWQAAERETAYRKELRRGFVLRPPGPVAVDCYFVGCKTAPPSYFHVLLYRDLLFEQLAAVLGVAIILLWIFRSRRDGTGASLVAPETRLKFSMSMALLFPPDGTFPLVSEFINIPRQIILRDALWIVSTIIGGFIFLVCTVVIYVLVSAIVWLVGSLSDSSGPSSQSSELT